MHKDKKSSVCIVGNSGDLLQEELGEKIDSCDTVIRLQKFKTEGFEKHVGSKTSIVSLAWRGVDQVMGFINYGSIDLNPSKLWSAHLLEGHRLSTIHQILGHSNIVQPSKEMYNKLIENLYSSFWRKVPSSGISTIELVLHHFSDYNIYICGFDDKIEKDHYYDAAHIDKLDPGMTVSGHNWEVEWIYIQDLISTEKISHIRNKK